MNMTLVVMAAGMGSRFGGLKQIEPVGPNGEFIVDYSVYDAIKAGFTKVVFIIKRENEQIFKNTIGSRFEKKIKVEYVFQELDDVPEGFKMPKDRVKPLGTGHAIRAARNVVNEPFAVISSDDFFGYDAFAKFANFLKNDCTTDTYGIVAYKVLDTVSKNGTVNRGVMFGENGILERITESTIEYVEDHYIGKPHNGEKEFLVDNETRATMLTYAFNPNIFDYIEEDFIDFLQNNQDNLDTCEFYLPNVVQHQIDKGTKKVLMIDTSATWHGLTYKEELEDLKKIIKSYHDNGIYPPALN